MENKAPLSEGTMRSGEAGRNVIPTCSEVGQIEEGKVWLRPVEVAEYLRVSRSSVYQWIRNGYIPCTRIGAQIRVNRSVLENLIDSGALAQ